MAKLSSAENLYWTNLMTSNIIISHQINLMNALTIKNVVCTLTFN